MKYICDKKCFFRNRLWTPGETLVPEKGEEGMLKYFKKYESKNVISKEEVEEPKTYAELYREDAKKALSSVGHGRINENSKVSKVSKKKNKDENFLS